MASLRFIADGMLGSSSRWLRMLGFDIIYCRDFPDDDLLKIAKNEKRILLTRDNELFRRTIASGLRAAFVEGISEAEKLASIANRFSITLDVDMSVTRCPICNSSLRNIDRDAVRDRLVPGTLKHYSKFWICEECVKVYWQGGHWKKIDEILGRAKELMEKTKLT